MSTRMEWFVAGSCGLAALARAARDDAFADRWLENAVLAVLDAPGAEVVYGGRPQLLDALEAADGGDLPTLKSLRNPLDRALD